jgi:curved DNA-binding protein CbpA
MSQESYVNYFEILELPDDCKPGEVRKNYKRLMKDLVIEIHRTRLTEDLRDKYLLKMAQLNAAFYILRDSERREHYVTSRARVIELEEEWQQAADADPEGADKLRRAFDQALRDFLSTYLEELMLEAGRDGECVEASHWDPYHERHAGRVLRLYRQRLYNEIHERLPFYDVSKPEIDWDERAGVAAALLNEGSR